ncbi:uncharacterized protein TNCV_1626331 [Trichonephila clavipes]|nr:uncharacterized protein TNCV_1626331 [Trichonephila clavipes]
MKLREWSDVISFPQGNRFFGGDYRNGNEGSLVVKVTDRGWRVLSSSPVPLKTRRVRKRCTLNLSRAETSSRWCGVVDRRGGASSGVVLVTSPRFKMMRSVTKSSRVAEQCNVNIHSLIKEVCLLATPPAIHTDWYFINGALQGIMAIDDRPRNFEQGSTDKQITWSVAKSPRVAEQCVVNIQSIN